MWRSHSDGIIWSPLPVNQRDWPITVPWRFHSVPRTPASEPTRVTHYCSMTISQCAKNPYQWTKENDSLLFLNDCPEPLPVNQRERPITVPWWFHSVPAPKKWLNFTHIKNSIFCLVHFAIHQLSLAWFSPHNDKFIQKFYLFHCVCYFRVEFNMILVIRKLTSTFQ